jgi:hypothetical protein
MMDDHVEKREFGAAVVLKQCYRYDSYFKLIVVMGSTNAY